MTEREREREREPCGRRESVSLSEDLHLRAGKGGSEAGKDGSRTLTMRTTRKSDASSKEETSIDKDVDGEGNSCLDEIVK